MRKALIIIVMILILIITGYTIIKGVNLGNLEILGISQMKAQDEELGDSVKKATKLASTDYQQKLDELNQALKKLQTEKTNYEDLSNVSTETEIQSSNKAYNTLDFIYVRIENHAKSEGVTLKLELTRNSSGEQDTYDINFTAVGTYTGIEEFITGIEDDSKLGFKIEEFLMVATNTNGDQVEATFVCKNIIIKGISSSTLSATSGTTQVDSTETNSNTTSNNTVGTTNSNTTSTTDTTDVNNKTSGNTAGNTNNNIGKD